MSAEFQVPHPPPGRGIFCNRTLNLRSIQAIGYDMDYTLVHYKVEAWERRAYEHVRARFLDAGWPVGHLEFDPQLCTRGLVIDLERGNVVKANRFGYVKRAFHGTRPLSFDEQRNTYSRVVVDLSEERFVFINTLFSISECCMFMQLVDMLDQHKLQVVMGYGDLYKHVRRTLDAAHMEGQLKAEIVADPARFVAQDPQAAQALLDQRDSGKRLLLITNSEWPYTQAMMTYCFDSFLPKGMSWRELFHMVLVSAHKPQFFSAKMPVFEVMTDTGLLRPVQGKLLSSGVYLGGSAALVESTLGVSGNDILYVGDHMFTDVHASKSVLRWRTALVVRELEEEIKAQEQFKAKQTRLVSMMEQKERLEYALNHLKLLSQRRSHGRELGVNADAELEKSIHELQVKLQELDAGISPVAKESSELFNVRWGPLMRAGNDKSHLARQVERYADIYMSRVSNFVYQTPFVFMRSPRGSLPHDVSET